MAQSSYEAITNPSFAANDRKKACGSSTTPRRAPPLDRLPKDPKNGSGTINGDADACTLALPSKSRCLSPPFRVAAAAPTQARCALLAQQQAIN